MNTKNLRNPSRWTGMISLSRLALFLLPGIVWMVPVASGQTSTTVNLGTQARNPDFSALPVTRPVSVGTSIPSTCVVGQLFFNSSAVAGQNLSSCTSNNTWTPVGNGLSLPLSVANGGNGTATPGLVAGTNVTISGAWPSQTVNASGAAVAVGSSLPAACTIGQLYFNSSSAAGSNLYGCTAANTWTVVGGATLSSPLPIANGGTGTATPSLVAGANVTISGAWPNQTINSSGGGGTSGNAVSIQGTSVVATAPSNNQTLIYSATSSAYLPTSVFTLQNGLGTSASGSSTLQVNVSMGVRSVTASTDNVANADCGGLVSYNNASAVAVALPQPGLSGNFVAGCPVTIRNNGAGTVTLTPTASTIGGASSEAVSANKGCLVVSDGANWQLGNCN